MDEPKLSIIIPVYNEGDCILYALSKLEELDNYDQCEVIVVDVLDGSTAQHITDPKIARVKSKKGRAAQMNAGAIYAKAEVLLFLHSDTILPKNGLTSVLETVSKDKIVGGSFNLSFDNSSIILGIIAKTASIRSHITRVPFGDQAIFIKKDVFQEQLGYKPIPLFEDVDFMMRIRNSGLKIHILDNYAMILLLSNNQKYF